MHEIEKESGGGLEPLQPSLASTRWRMGHPPIVRVIPKLVAPAGFEPTHKESESSVLPDYTKEQLNRFGCSTWICTKTLHLQRVLDCYYPMEHS